MTNIQPVTALTVEQRLAALETKTSNWIKLHWPHFITWLGLAWGFFKHL